MKKNITRLLLLCVLVLTQVACGQPNDPYADYRIVYKGDSGPGKGKNIVFIASDHEYRSEESLPALARILAKRYGFTCTVVFGLDSQRNILPGSSDLRGLDALNNADLMVIFTRFSDFPDEEMQHINDYLEKGKPVVGLRTATHAFNNAKNPKWGHYSYQYKGPNTTWRDGFGETILGETWVGHYGKNHAQASRLLLEQGQESHPVLAGVKDVFVQCGGYNAEPELTGSTVLARGQVLNGMTPDSPADTSKKELPVAWVRNYKLDNGASGRVFTTTHGASEDLLNEGFRRMLVNACFWTMGMEKDIDPQGDVNFVGPYQPTTFNFDGYKANVKPADLAGFESLIMPGEIVTPKKK
ncbi:ThuA domain-containing protein [Chitinophaga alhagiae]|uniref:ThuA domain-containing protein n=1 Tax=Chitinophaga alhagiae TaxID=2203219 RepID=UPI000E5A1CC8|nr:ThuA domain-containing protein [Chitinophaga alhagiae]